MSQLILKRFQCAIDTNEVGGESPYFVTFVGDIGTGATTTMMTRQGNWHNEVDKGEIWTVNHTVASGFALVPAKTLVLSAMVEEDEGLDISSAEMQTIAQNMHSFFQGFLGGASITSSIRVAMSNRLKTLMQGMLLSSSGADDDLMGVKALKLNGNAGDQSLVSFSGDGGLDRVRYAVA
jgi:hypothetical protein